MLFVSEQSKEGFLSYSSDLELVNCNASIQCVFATSINNLIKIKDISHENARVGVGRGRCKTNKKHQGDPSRMKLIAEKRGEICSAVINMNWM